MTRAALVVAVVSALCLGISIGFMGGVMFTRHTLAALAHPGAGFGRHGWHGSHRGPRGAASPGMLMPRLQEMLDLTPEQAEAIRGEIERSRGDFAQVRDSLHARIERHLTPQQRDKWHSAEREWNPGAPGGSDPHNLRGKPGREGERSR